MDLIVSTVYGKVRGRVADGVARFLGIPFAAAPFGEHRFRAPAPVVPWDGVRDALEYGPTVPKAPYRPPLYALLPEVDLPGEECLNLNVWAPRDAEGLPVLVWVHGGAFRNGSGSVPVYDGGTFARDGVVCVTINYRLGVEGFAELPGAPRNRGLLDQIAALEWVRDNIAAFGGDPEQVTVFGESAGGMSVATLLSLDLGLFHRAIAQSGAGHIAQLPEDALKVTAELARRLGVEPTAEGLAEITPERIVEVQAEVQAEIGAVPDPGRWGYSTVQGGMPFMPVLDAELFTRRPIDAVRDGAGRDIPLLTGTNSDEFRLYLAPSGMVDLLNVELVTGLLATMGIEPGTAETYQANRPGAKPGDIMSAVITDWFFRVPAIRLAEAKPHNTWMYEFAWNSGAQDVPAPLKACHALELGFVFDALASTEGRGLVGPNPPQALADTMHAAWVAFAKTGDPGWPRYDEARTVQVFDVEPALTADPRADERKLCPDR
ncbi:carboxylesterase family protein [Actinocorallia lasiicapitis]